MTIHIFVRDASAQEKLSSRPERSEVEGPAVKSVPFCLKPNLDKSDFQPDRKLEHPGSGRPLFLHLQ
jgi:hypothetical protein